MQQAECALDNMWQDAHDRAKRFKDPPPADMKPDEKYEPEIGDWFWHWSEYGIGKWMLFHRLSGTKVVDKSDSNPRVDFTENVWRHKMLPATAPE